MSAKETNSSFKSLTDHMSSTLTASLTETGNVSRIKHQEVTDLQNIDDLTLWSSESLISFAFVDYSPISLLGAENAVHLVGSQIGSASVMLCDLNARALLLAQDQQLSAEELQFLAAHRSELAARWALVSHNE